MNALSPLHIWLRVHRYVLVSAAAAALMGAMAAPIRVSARTEEMIGPSFSSAIFLPCLGASLGIYLSLPLTPQLEAMSVRRMPLWRAQQALVSLATTLAMVTPASFVAAQDSTRIYQNLAVFTAAGLVVARLTSPIFGVALPWIWSMGALLFGLDYSDLGKPRWAWWAWIIGDAPRIATPLLICLVAIAATSALPARRNPTI